MELSSPALQNTVIVLLHNITALVLSGGFGFDDWVDYSFKVLESASVDQSPSFTSSMVNSNDCVTEFLPAVTLENILLLNHNNKVHQTK